MALAYLLCPTFQIVNSAGKPATGGYLEVYLAGSRTKYFCSSDFDGTRHPFQIPLDSLGSNVVLADDAHTYDVYVYNRYGTLLMSRYGVSPGAGGGAGFGVLTSSDGSLTIVETANGYDLSVNGLETSALIAGADQLISDGQFVFEQLSRDGTLLSVDRSGKVRMNPAWYHFTAIVELSYDGTPVNESHQVTLWTTLSNSVIDLDTSYAHRESIELSGDIHVVGTNVEFPLGVSGLDTGITASLVSFDIHAVTGKGGNSEYHAGEGITINDTTKTISADFDSVQEKLVAGENISITGNVITAVIPSQEQSDWTEDDNTSPTYVRNKPDLDVYATQAQLTYGLAGKQDTISDLATIRSGAAAGASAVQPADLANVATTGNYNDLNNRPNLTVYATTEAMNTALATKQDVISDLSTIRSGAAAGATAVQPADLTAGLATKQDVLTPGDNITISNNVISATDQRQADWSQSDSSAVDYIRNKPDLSTYATDAELTAGLATKQDTINDLSEIRSGAAAGASAVQPADLATVATTGDYDDLTDKPDLSVYATGAELTAGLATKQDTISDLATIRSGAAEGATAVQPADLATVATTGSYDDLVDKPTIPAAQVNSDWNSNSGVSQILNKPTLATVATTGDYDDLSNKPSIPAAQVNSDWNAVSGVSEILNKPNLATVATTGAYSDLTGTPTINNVPAVTSSDNDKVLKASYSGGVGSYSWQTEQGGGSTYTAGDAIDITNDEISVLYDSDTLKLKPQDQTFTYALGTWDENYGRAYAQTTADIRGILEEEAGLELTLHIPANTFYLNGTYGENIVLRISDDPYFNYSNYCLTPLAVTYDSVENKTWIDEQDIILHTPDQDPDYWHISSDHSARYVAFGLTSGSNLCTITSTAAGDDVTVTFTHAGGDPLLAVKNPLPASAIADAAKVLTVDNTGAPVWATAQAPISAGNGIDITNNVVSAKVDGTTVTINASGELEAAPAVTVDQTYNASSTNPQSGTAVAGALESYTPTTSLATVATTGSYTDLSNTPSIPTATSDLTNDSGFITLSDVPAQVNADWNSSSGASEILNKPTIPSGTQLVPAATSADADKVLTVDAQGVPGWATGGGSQVQADWAESDSSEPSYIENKPVPKTLTAGTGISITENQSTITIANTVTPPTVDQTYSAASTNAQSGTAVADAIGNLGTNLSAAQLLALKEALGCDETVLYEDSTGSGTVQLSEDPNRFERLGITYHLWNDNAGEQYVEVPANQTLYTFGGDYVPASGNTAHFFTRLSYSTPTLTCVRHCYVNNGNPSTVSDGTSTFKFYKVVGIHRIASN